MFATTPSTGITRIHAPGFVAGGIAVALVALGAVGCNPPTREPAGKQRAGGGSAVVVPEPERPNVGEFDVVTFGSDPTVYDSDWQGAAEPTKLTLSGNGLRCAVSSTGQTEAGAYGGVRLPIHGADSFRLKLSLNGLEDIYLVLVDVHGDNRNVRMRRWSATAEALLAQNGDATFEFSVTDGTATAPFSMPESFGPELKGSSAVPEAVEIYVKLRSGPRSASFVVRQLEIHK